MVWELGMPLQNTWGRCQGSQISGGTLSALENVCVWLRPGDHGFCRCELVCGSDTSRPGGAPWREVFTASGGQQTA